ncbi:MULTISPECIES: DUF2147 domain-containing protein [unclassified Novosphingobium]|uniref:DUF2147 domain-containing protein n=1 Tax=unclassified Novosphingobium TaxID=2644732 RepID=UPI001359F352|nr:MULTISPECIES: DUF2147 domain-containing protein [unclassified Novosphingobium]
MRYALLIPSLVAMASPAFAREGHVAADAEGIWLNPKHTVAVHTDACGPNSIQNRSQSLCGQIVWASNQARADARDSDVPRLLGTEILEDYRFRGHGTWSGTVFVPDMGRHFASEIDQLSPTQLRVKGCILGGLLCKSQVWTRIGQVPA